MLLLDAGGVFGGYDDEAPRRAEALIGGMSLIGYDALNLGEDEFRFGRTFLDEQQSEAGFPFLSANLVDRQSSELAYTPYVVREVGHLRIGIIGLTSPMVWTDESDTTVQVRDPVSVLGTLLPRVKEEAHIVIVLAHMPYAEAISILNHVESVNVVILTHEGELAVIPQESKEVLMVSAGEQGKYVGQLQIVANTAGRIIEYRGTAVKLDEQVEEDSTLLELLVRHGIH